MSVVRLLTGSGHFPRRPILLGGIDAGPSANCGWRAKCYRKRALRGFHRQFPRGGRRAPLAPRDLDARDLPARLQSDEETTNEIADHRARRGKKLEKNIVILLLMLQQTMLIVVSLWLA